MDQKNERRGEKAVDTYVFQYLLSAHTIFCLLQKCSHKSIRSGVFSTRLDTTPPSSTGLRVLVLSTTVFHLAP